MPSSEYHPSCAYRIACWCINGLNTLTDVFRARRWIPSASPDLQEVLDRARTRTDISDHLPTLFAEALLARPRLIVELGVRGGESTFVLERVARLFNAQLVSVDLEDNLRVSLWSQWVFVKSDDITFAREFPQWCAGRQIQPKIDFLFIDTSHRFEHTVQEITSWFPWLGEQAKVAFHDTNQHRIYRRRDGSIGLGWRNRGVIAALEHHFNRKFDETVDFVELLDGWLITHHAVCNGFTVLTRVPTHLESGSACRCSREAT